ncbi:MAG: hypothetical protein ACW986_06535 [Promethearchaeota archaeon]|jgi:hypothetical protein
MSRYKVLAFCGVILLVMGVTWIFSRILWAIPLLSDYSSNKMAMGEILIGSLASPIIIFIVPGSILVIFRFKNRIPALKTCPNCGNKIEVSWNVCIRCAYQLKV